MTIVAGLGKNLTMLTVVFISLTVCIAVSTAYTTLFSYDDPVSQLWSNNFTSVIHGSNKMWFIMFYAAWCGHCQSVAPIFSNFSKNIRGWSPVVGLAVVECAERTNQELCKKYGVKGFPTFKLFPPNTDSSFVGTPIPTNNGREDDHEVVLRYLDELVRTGQADSSWPLLSPVQRSARELWADRETRQVFVVAEDSAMNEDNIGLSVILDLLPAYPTVVVGRMVAGGASPVNQPGLYSASRRDVFTLISRESSENLLVHAINSKTTNEQRGQTTSRMFFTTARPITYRRQAQGLHMRDLESSLYRSLWIEIPFQPSIAGKRLAALKSYLDLLVQYNPVEEHAMRFLRKLNDWLKTTNESVSAAQWTSKLASLQSADAFIPHDETYSACNGSRPQFRGYPCGLWMTFHALTVGAYQKQKSSSSFRPADILTSIGGYIEHFFGCRYCAQHFATLLQPMQSEVSAPRDVVLWLWKAHNRVNSRLHGVITEDPQAPKIQFPSRESCAGCIRSTQAVDPFQVAEDNWSESDVLDYLVAYYSKRNVIDDHDEIRFKESNSGTEPFVVDRWRTVWHVGLELGVVLITNIMR